MASNPFAEALRHSVEVLNDPDAAPPADGTPPGFKEGLCAITVPGGAVRYVAGWDLYRNACHVDKVSNDIHRGDRFQSPEAKEELNRAIGLVCRRGSFYRQVYVVLSKMGVPWDIVHFIEAGASDTKLPFKLTRDGKAFWLWHEEELQEYEAGRALGEATEDWCYDGGRPAVEVPGWLRARRHAEFFRVQFEQLAVKFHTGESYKMQADMWVLPLTMLAEDKVPAEQRLNETQLFVMQPGSYDFSGVNELFKVRDGEVAVKQLEDTPDNPSAADAYEKEVQALRIVSQHKHKHILPLLSSYTRPSGGIDEYVIIYPQADCSLETLWEKHHENKPSNKTLLWMLSQCRGIVDALVHIHHQSKGSLGTELAGCHGNIDLENILVFKDATRPEEEDHLGMLVLSGFEKAMFHFWDCAEEVPDTSGPSHWWDIWCLGCFFLKFVAFYLGGGDLLGTLENRFVEVSAVVGKANESNLLKKSEGSESIGDAIRKMVVQFSKKLKGYPRYGDVQPIVDFVLESMLIVDVGVDGTRRASMEDVLGLFTTLLDASWVKLELEVQKQRDMESFVEDFGADFDQLY